MKKLILAATVALIVAPQVGRADGLNTLGNTMLKNSADAAAGAAKKTAEDEADKATAGARGQADAAHGEVKAKQEKAEAVRDNAEGLNNAVKALGK